MRRAPAFLLKESKANDVFLTKNNVYKEKSAIKQRIGWVMAKVLLLCSMLGYQRVILFRSYAVFVFESAEKVRIVVEAASAAHLYYGQFALDEFL